MNRVTPRTVLLATTAVVFVAAAGFVTLKGGEAQESTQGRAARTTSSSAANI